MIVWGGAGSQGGLFNTMDVYELDGGLNHKPVVRSFTISPPPDINGFRDKVTMSLKIDDEDNDALTLSFEYSLDGGKNWIFIDPLNQVPRN